MPRLLVLLLLLVASVRGAVSAERPHVYLVIVDGLDARFATAERMPRVFEVLAKPDAHASILTGRAVMPTRTNSNHVSLLTGVYAGTHGITGNSYWSRRPKDEPTKLQAAALIEVQTLFTVAAETSPPLVTSAVFAKAKLGKLFADVPARQHGPQHLWTPDTAGFLEQKPDDDAGTMEVALDLFGKDEPALGVIQLADVDRNGHAHGADGPEYAAAVTRADAAIRHLIDRLREDGRWQSSVLIVTGDHGMESVAPTAEHPEPIVPLVSALATAGVDGVHVALDGGVAHVYADGLASDATDVGDAAARLGRVAEVARAQKGVSEVLARLPLAGVPLLAEVHPDWHLANQRTGELLLVSSAGYHLVDEDEAGEQGNHGSPRQEAVPLFVAGGFAGLRAVARLETPTPAPAVGRTIAVLLGLPPPKRVDGRPLAEAELPAPLAELLAPPAPPAPEPVYSPHWPKKLSNTR